MFEGGFSELSGATVALKESLLLGVESKEDSFALLAVRTGIVIRPMRIGFSAQHDRPRIDPPEGRRPGLREPRY
jgi:hypothetical protein